MDRLRTSCLSVALSVFDHWWTDLGLAVLVLHCLSVFDHWWTDLGLIVLVKQLINTVTDTDKLATQSVLYF